MIKLKINGKNIEAAENTTIFEAAEAAGIKIPALCYHKGLSVYGGCRLCIVKIKGRPGFPISCATPVAEGMEVETHTPEICELRKDILDLIFAYYPEDFKKIKNIELKRLAEEVGLTELKYQPVKREHKIDGTSLAIRFNGDRCIHCGRCVRTCREIQHAGILTSSRRGPTARVSTFMDKGLGNVDCTGCGQCLINCPVGAIEEAFKIDEVKAAIKDPKKHVVFQIAPSVRFTIGEEFGLAPGSNMEKQIVTALRKLGADQIFDTVFTADLTIMEEGSEFIKRFTEGGKLPLITSCCPGWIRFAEEQLPELLENISSCKSPQQMFGALLKSYYAEKQGIAPENIVSVSVMPCTAKKAECMRPEMTQHGVYDVDYVLTTRELATMIKDGGLNLPDLPESEYDAPFGITTGAGVIFGVSGGVMEAALRTAYELITQEELPKLDFDDVRGLQGIKSAEVDIKGTKVKVAVVNGLENAWQLLKHADDYHFIEIMACPGGCIGGGGQPISKEPDYMEKRKRKVYADDKNMKLRKSHENPAVQQLYKEFLGHPLSEKSHKYLHLHKH
jgi:iron-only hydrogenase group A